MSAVQTIVAQAIADQANAAPGGTFTLPFTAVRSWADWDEALCDMGVLHVDVVPAGIIGLPQEDREPSLAYQVQTDIGVRQAFGQDNQATATGRLTNTVLDRLALLGRQLHEYFTSSRLDDDLDAVWQRTQYRVPFSRKHLRTLRQWTSIFRITHDYTKAV